MTMLKGLKEFQMLRFAFLVFLLAWAIPDAANSADSQTIKPLNEVTFLGLPVVGAKKSEVISHLWALGGFTQARSTLQKKAYDRFFTKYRLEDSYFVAFRYTAQQELVTAKRLFRPRSIAFQNQRSLIKTKQVADEIASEIGPPTRIERRQWGGLPAYNAYIWENDQVKVTVDREGSEWSGNIFALYEVKIDRYKVAQNTP